MIIKRLVTRIKGGGALYSRVCSCNFNASTSKRDDWVVLRGDDLRLEERVTFRITGGTGPKGKPRPSSCDGYAVRIEAFFFTIKY